MHTTSSRRSFFAGASYAALYTSEMAGRGGKALAIPGKSGAADAAATPFMDQYYDGILRIEIDAVAGDLSGLNCVALPA